MSFKEKLVKKQKEKREAELVARERELHHIQVLKEAAIEAKKEKKAPEGAYISLCNVNKIYPNHVQAVFDFNIDIKEKIISVITNAGAELRIKNLMCVIKSTLHELAARLVVSLSGETLSPK